MTTTQNRIVLSTMFAAGVFAAYWIGYLQFVFEGDRSLVSYVIAAIVVLSVVASMFTSKHLKRAAWLCETLGFIGTLVGITIGLSAATDLTSAEGLIAAGNSLFSGVGTAFCSTIVGAIGMLWLWGLDNV